jgi:hypothetical protein
MKGMEFKAILVIIVVVAIVFIAVLIAFIPGFAFGENMKTQTSFRDFCLFWSLNGYKEGNGQPVERSSVIYGCPSGCADYPNYCPSAIGNPLGGSLTEEEVERCRNICRGVA